jgi:Holliday junction resolvase-like predicted endonuclease
VAARWLALDKDELGLLGERIARGALARAGLRVLGRRVRARGVEVDLVALAGDVLVCVEVKTAAAAPGTRRDPRTRPGRRLDRERVARQLAAGRELARHVRGVRVRGIRVDLVEVWIETGGWSVAVEHGRVPGAAEALRD